MNLRQSLLDLDLDNRPAEKAFRERMVELLETTVECFLRTCFPSHFTGSALVVNADGERALLHHHRKLDRWLQFGGHCDGEEDLLQVACREAQEESGIEGLIVASARPFDLDIHEIPARGSEPAHFHFDVRYVLIAPEDAAVSVSSESHDVRWFTATEMLELPLDEGQQRMVAKWRALVARRQHQSITPG